jgi:hypothetical protein
MGITTPREGLELIGCEDRRPVLRRFLQTTYAPLAKT